MPGYLVFGLDMILNIPFILDWGSIRLRKQKKDKNNQLENKNFKSHTYRIQDKVLVCNKKSIIRISDNPNMEEGKFHHTPGRCARSHKHKMI